MAFSGGPFATSFYWLGWPGLQLPESLAGTAGPAAGKERSGVISKASARAADPVMEERPAFNIPPFKSSLAPQN